MSQHAIDRAKERYGVEFTPEDIAAIVALLLAGYGLQFGYLNGNDRCIFLVEYGGCKYRLVFHVVRAQVVTFLPLFNDRPRNKRPAVDFRRKRDIYRAGRRRRAK